MLEKQTFGLTGSTLTYQHCQLCPRYRSYTPHGGGTSQGKAVCFKPYRSEFSLTADR